jgi:hypothetical protein
MLELFRNEAEPSDYEKVDEDTFFINFSDTNIRAIPTHSKSNVKRPRGFLFKETLNIAHIQARLIFAGIFVRGSLALGDLFVQDGMIFGPALIQGYYMETEISVYPRVTIHPKVLRAYETKELLKASHHDLDTDKEYVLRHLRRDIDGIYYVDYLKTMDTEFDYEGGYGNFLDHHKKLIESRVKKLTTLNSVSVKYSWLIEYHNSTVRSYGEEVDGWDAEGLLIDPSVLPARHDMKPVVGDDGN